VRHKNDADSVAAWVAHTKQQEATCNIVRFCKFQGEDSDYNLNKMDFMLVIASDSQLIAGKQFCAPMHEICMDSTHGLNAYDFQLTTLLGIDKHGEGFPIAFCYSSHVDERSMTVFLQVVKEALGTALADVVLMTDDTEVYVNAWCAVMGPPAYRLLCVWHVDRAWRKNLTRIKGGSDVKTAVYKTLRSLMEIPDRDTFDVKLSEFLQSADDDTNTADFAKYFRHEYAYRCELWAYCHRLGLHVHHNMHLEAMHRVLKHVHLNGRKVKRLDKSIEALMQFMRAKLSDRLLKLYKGKWTRHVGGIRKRHQASGHIQADACMCIEDNLVYMVQGSKGEMYAVRQAQSVPHQDRVCQLSCTDCNVCVHTFSCTCMDSALRNTICKHVHAVVQKFSPVQQCTRDGNSVACTEQPTVSSDHEEVEDTCPAMPTDVGAEISCATGPGILPSMSESAAILAEMTARHKKHDVQSNVRKCDEMCMSIRATIRSHPELAKVGMEHLTKLQCLLTVLQDKPDIPRLPPTENNEPVNKKAMTQRHFVRTSKTRKVRNPEKSMTKPTHEEKEYLLSALSGNTTVISQQPPMDHDYAGDVIGHTINFEHSYGGPQ